ncbi:MAG: hypothetical protein PHY34_02100 [Patescibacteria group bacterium]|nr:hypothetical protein [Patescibacteria group bacterium]MDD5715274.1 hypothetical protein [Patescibacteria group bacterium]
MCQCHHKLSHLIGEGDPRGKRVVIHPRKGAQFGATIEKVDHGSNHAIVRTVDGIRSVALTTAAMPHR